MNSELNQLLNAVNSIDEEAPDFLAELKEAAWNVLRENPGCEYSEWVQTLIEQYPAEVVDALGPNPEEAYQGLSDLWDWGEYEDEVTGENHKIKEWAEYFATEHSVEIYNMLADSKREIKALRETLKAQLSKPST